MSSITCPHCHANIPMGATACTGCQGDVVYGTPIDTLKAAMGAGGLGGAALSWGLLNLIYGPMVHHVDPGTVVTFLAVGAVITIILLLMIVTKLNRGRVTVDRRRYAG